MTAIRKPLSLGESELTEDQRLRSAHADRVRERILQALLFCLPFALLMLYFKRSYLRWEGGLFAAKKALGVSQFSSVQIARFYAEDVLEALVFLPLLLFLVTWRLEDKPSRWVSCLIVQLLLVLNLVASSTYHALGRFPNRELIVDFLSTYRVDPAAVSPFTSVTPAYWLNAVLVSLFVCLPLVLLAVGRIRRLTNRYLLLPLMGFAGALGMAAVVTGMSGPRATIYHRGHMRWVASEFVLPDREIALLTPQPLSRQELRSMYDRLAFPHGKGVKATTVLLPALGDTTNRMNVLLIILETANHQDYSFRRDTAVMPNVASLLPNALVASSHIASHPYSVRSEFTLFTSIYDLAGRRSSIALLRGRQCQFDDALPWILRRRGYDTHYYLTGDFYRLEEERMVHCAGFESASHGSGGWFWRSPSSRVEAEGRNFEQVTRRLSASGPASPPLFAVVRSMIGHTRLIDPYAADRASRPPLRTVTDTMRAIQSFLDGQIGNILDALRKTRELENTLIAIVGDHGARTGGYPGVDSRFATAATFHVPMMIYAPQRLATTLDIGQVTSHVDVAPTILALLGIQTEDRLHHGLPMFDPRLAARITFFLGGNLHASSGAHYRGRYFSRNAVTGAAFLSDSFQFDVGNLVDGSSTPGRSADAAFFDGRLRALSEVQVAWLSSLHFEERKSRLDTRAIAPLPGRADSAAGSSARATPPE